MGHLTLVFDHVPGGKGSGYLSSLKPGTRIPLSGPYGHFVLPDPDSKHLLLIGHYSGLVPLRCMIRSLENLETGAVAAIEDQCLSLDLPAYGYAIYRIQR